MSARRAPLWACFSRRRKALFVNKAALFLLFFFSLAGGVNDGSFSFSASSRAGNNPEITCRDDALMILVMKKLRLFSAATDWKEPACLQCNGPTLDNPSESMQSMRPSI